MSVFLALAGPAAADSLVKRHSFELSPEVYYHKYEEPDVMEQKGIFYGARAAYEFHQGLYARAEAAAAFGQVDYSSPSSGTLDNIDDWLFEPRVLAGYDLNLAQHLLVTPFFGFSYRYLNDDSSDRSTDTGALGYERASNYFYSPIGLTAVVEPATGLKVRASGEYDLFWKGKQKSYLSDVVYDYGDLENDQDSGYGLRGALALEKTGKSTDWWIEGFFRYWNIDDSDVQPVTFQGTIIGLGYEPANETVEVGAMIGIRF